MSTAVDIHIFGRLGFYTIFGISEDGRAWVTGNVQEAINGTGWCDDTSWTQDIANGATDAGLVVAVNGEGV
jgi:hypothetical protein